MHGAGNDFVILDLRRHGPPSRDLLRALSDRHTGVGCDQILGIEAPRSSSAVASYRIWTADGSPSQQCGNGARCVAAWLLKSGTAKEPSFLLDSPTRTHNVDTVSEGVFQVGMGLPDFHPSSLPMEGFPSEKFHYETYLDPFPPQRFFALSVGNPHAVVVVPDIDDARVAEIGPMLQRSSHLPRDVNVGFVQVMSPIHVRLRVYEYGAGETLACGSGACAAVASLIRCGRVDREVKVQMKGGDLSVSWPNETDEILMSGPAKFVFEGVFIG